MKLKRFPVGPMSTNCYLLIDEPTQTAAVFDPGYDAAFIYEKLNKQRLSCAMILLTHGHADHTGGLEEMRRLTGAPLYIHASDAAMLDDPSLSMAKFIGAPENQIKTPEHFLSDGDKIMLGETALIVMCTPGHTPGSVCFLIHSDDKRIIITGDTLFKGGIGRYDLPGGDFPALKKSLRRIAELEGEWGIYPGHGSPSLLSLEKKTNMYMLS